MKTSLAKKVGSSVARFRKLAGLTQASVAETLNVETETISRMETGVISLTLERLEQFSNIYKCPVIAFFHDPKERSDNLTETVADLIRPLKSDEIDILLHFISVTVSLFKKTH